MCSSLARAWQGKSRASKASSRVKAPVGPVKKEPAAVTRMKKQPATVEAQAAVQAPQAAVQALPAERAGRILPPLDPAKVLTGNFYWHKSCMVRPHARSLVRTLASAHAR